MSEHVSRDHPTVVRAKARVIMVEFIFRWFLVLVGVVILTLVVVDTLQGREVRRELVSCGVEGGACYERTQDNIEAAIQRIYEQGLDRERITRQIILLANACEDEQGPDLDAITECVNERLGRENHVTIEGVE